MKTLEYYSQKMREYESLPHQLSSLLLGMSADYGQAMNQKMELEMERAQFFVKHKGLSDEKPVSDKMLDMLFIRDGNGKKLLRCDIYIKGSSSMMSVIKSHLRNLTEESKNQF